MIAANTSQEHSIFAASCTHTRINTNTSVQKLTHTSVSSATCGAIETAAKAAYGQHMILQQCVCTHPKHTYMDTHTHTHTHTPVFPATCGAIEMAAARAAHASF